MDIYRVNQLCVHVEHVTMPGSDVPITKRVIDAIVPINATANTIIFKIMGRVRMSEVLQLDLYGLEWRHLIQSILPGLKCPYVDHAHANDVEDETMYELLLRGVEEGAFHSKMSLSLVFANLPFFEVFTLNDLLRCHNDTDPIYLNACMPLGDFRLYWKNVAFAGEEIITWRMSGMEAQDAQFHIECARRIAHVLNVPEESIEDEMEIPFTENVLVCCEDPIGVVCNVYGDKNPENFDLKLPESVKPLFDAIPHAGKCYFIPFKTTEDAYKYSWPLYHAKYHVKGQSKESRVAKIVMYLFYSGSSNESERVMVAPFVDGLTRSLEKSPHEVANCSYPYMKQYVSPSKRLRLDKVPDKISKSIGKL